MTTNERTEQLGNYEADRVLLLAELNGFEKAIGTTMLAIIHAAVRHPEWAMALVMESGGLDRGPLFETAISNLIAACPVEA